MLSMLLEICEQDEHPHPENVFIDASVTAVRDLKVAHGYTQWCSQSYKGSEQTDTPVGMKNLPLPFLTLRRGLGAGKVFCLSLLSQSVQ